MSKNASALYEAAKTAMANSYSPYSEFPVGAAILAGNGKTYTGANIENVAFPQGWCAETSAIAHMVMDGETHIVEVAVSAEKLAECSPCGGCRQKLAEFGSADTIVHLGDQSGITKSVTLGELLPFGFSTDSLK